MSGLFHPFSSILALMLLSVTAHAADKYRIDTTHSTVSFTMQHDLFAKYQGIIRNVRGSFVFDKADLSKSSVVAHMEVKDVDTVSVERDQEFQGIMDTNKNPDINFKSTAVEKTGDKTGKITGDLSMAGVTRSVTLLVTFDNEAISRWDGAHRAAFSAAGSLDTNEFGIVAFDGLHIGPKIDFAIELEGVTP